MRYQNTTNLAGAVALLLALCLTACGVTATSTTGKTSTTPSPTRGSPTLTPGSAALNGCPIQQAPVGWPPADVVLTMTGAQGATATPGLGPIHVTVMHGQIIDVRLSATYQWRITSAPSATVLTMAQPAGWYDPQYRACVWRFTAAGTGATGLQLTGTVVCQPETPCSTIALLASYQITVR